MRQKPNSNPTLSPCPKARPVPAHSTRFATKASFIRREEASPGYHESELYFCPESVTRNGDARAWTRRRTLEGRFQGNSLRK